MDYLPHVHEMKSYRASRVVTCRVYLFVCLNSKNARTILIKFGGDIVPLEATPISIILTLTARRKNMLSKSDTLATSCIVWRQVIDVIFCIKYWF
jgi:hypothetical protein